MLAKKKEPAPPEEEEQREVEILVDPMTTSLGLEEELMPAPGPEVPSDAPTPADERPLWVCVSPYSGGRMPSEALQAQYFEWLRASEVSLCRAQYMQCTDSFEMNEEQYGDSMSEEEILAQEQAEEALMNEDGELPPVVEMTKLALPFVVGNCHVVRAHTREEVMEWLQDDPIAALDGYEYVNVHKWSCSDDSALNMPLASQTGYAVHSLDKPDSVDLRAATRSAHLAWLTESGRVHLGGPLHSPEADDDRVGTFLIVNGDDAASVVQWAAEDPYVAAGLFADQLVAPLLTYAVPCTKIGFQAEMADEAIARAEAEAIV